MAGADGLQLSVVMVVYRMRREAPRTLHSLSAAYQHGVSADQYEVIVVENPSDQMLQERDVVRHGPQFRYLVNPTPSRSPASAINLGARSARAQNLTLLIDGARILSPGILWHTLAALRLYNRPVVATLGWHLGPDNQARSIHRGYCQEVEDRLLARSAWQDDGYRLFNVSAMAGSSEQGWFMPISESNCLTMSREQYEALGGYSEEFQSPGGGLLNLDFYERAVSDPRRQLVMLLGEGTFHQFHGGVATNRRDDEPMRAFREEYERLRGRRYSRPRPAPVYFGGMNHIAIHHLQLSMKKATEAHAPQHKSLAQAQASKAPAERLVRWLAVLGMHRSGTSLLAGTLVECGVEFGAVSRWNKYNRKGNHEHQEIMDLHERLLADSGGAWDRPPPQVRWEPQHRQARDAILAQLRASGAGWLGFKDPRTLLALGGWTEVLPNLRWVGIFRHPAAVARSLANRDRLKRSDALALWSEYNGRLLALYREQPFPILHFSEDAALLRRQLECLVQQLRLTPPAGGLSFYEQELRHFDAAGEEELPPQVAELYRQLHEVAYYQADVQASFMWNRRAAAKGAA